MNCDEALDAAGAAFEDGELEEALRLLQLVAAQRPAEPRLLELQGLVYAELGDADAADRASEALLRLEPDNVTALLTAADARIRDSAEDGSRVEAGLALLDRAAPLARREALAQFERALALDPELGEARLERAIALFELGRVAEARPVFEALARDWPDEAWSYHYLALLAERRGEDPQPLFARARTLAPEEFPPPVHLSEEAFDAAVKAAIEALPAHARLQLDNVTIDVQPLPDDDELREGLSPTILGVFQGTPLDERLDTHAEHHHTARIVLFQKNLERFARTHEALLEEIRITVLHEVGHLLGLDEDELRDRGLD